MSNRPLTEHEISGGWTSAQDEAAFLTQVAADTPAQLSSAGVSDEGHDIWRLDLGNASGSTWAILVHVHATEPAPREAALAFMRDLAYSTDPDVVDYLTRHRVVLITPVNPDGLVNGTRHPDRGDINRDYLAFTGKPAAVVARALRAIDPHLVVDGHEQSVSGTTNDMEFFGIGTVAVHPALRNITDQMLTEMQQTVQAQGYTCEPYPRPGRVSGREASAFHHAASILLESWSRGEPERRVRCFRDTFEVLRLWHEANAEALDSAKRSSRAAATINDPSPYVLQTGVTAIDGNWPTITLPAGLDGYTVRGALPADVMDAYGVRAYGNFVPMRQWARAVIPLLFDPASDDRLADAVRVLGAGPTGYTGDYFHR